MRPGLISKYGLDDETLCAERKDLIYCNIWAFGREGPLSRHPGYDPLMQAYGGLMSVTGEPERAPRRGQRSRVTRGNPRRRERLSS